MTVARVPTHFLRFLRFAALIVLLAPVFAQDSRPTDYQVKAAYLVKFGKFIEYPTASRITADEKFSVCVLGQDPFAAVVDSAAQGETVAGSAVAIRRIGRVEDAAACRVLFVSASEDARLRAFSRRSANRLSSPCPT